MRSFGKIHSASSVSGTSRAFRTSERCVVRNRFLTVCCVIVDAPRMGRPVRSASSRAGGRSSSQSNPPCVVEPGVLARHGGVADVGVLAALGDRPVPDLVRLARHGRLDPALDLDGRRRRLDPAVDDEEERAGEEVPADDGDRDAGRRPQPAERAPPRSHYRVISRTSSLTVPAGTFTSTTSPTSRASSAFPIGLSTEIRFCLRSASWGETRGVDGLLVRLLVEDADVREDAGLRGVDLALVDDAGVRDGVLELGDPGLEMALGLLGRVVLGVLGEVALGAGLGDLLRDPGALDGPGVVELVLELLEPLGGEVNGGAHGV